MDGCRALSLRLFVMNTGCQRSKSCPGQYDDCISNAPPRTNGSRRGSDFLPLLQIGASRRKPCGDAPAVSVRRCSIPGAARALRHRIPSANSPDGETHGFHLRCSVFRHRRATLRRRKNPSTSFRIPPSTCGQRRTAIRRYPTTCSASFAPASDYHFPSCSYAGGSAPSLRAQSANVKFPDKVVA